MIGRILTSAVLTLAAAAVVAAHDPWVQPNAAVVRTGDAVHLDVMLGNHGNDHRDFKLAGKLTPDSLQATEVVAPDGKRYDLKPDLADLGYAPSHWDDDEWRPGIVGRNVLFRVP